MYTRPRQPHHTIPSMSNIPLFPPSSHNLSKNDQLPPWYPNTETLLRPDPPIHQNSSPPFHHPLPPFHPPPLQSLTTWSKTEPKEEIFLSQNLRKVAPVITKPHRNPHLPAEKNSAQQAAKIAADCEDLGPGTAQRFKCQFRGCDKFFQRRYNLKVHVRKHTNEKPYTCSERGCGKKFTWRSSIAHHLKAHRKRNKLVSETLETSSTKQSVNEAYVHTEGSSIAASCHTSSNADGGPGCKVDDRGRRGYGRLLPTSPISSETFGLEHIGLSGAGGDVGMEELNFHHEHVSGMIFDHMM